MKNKEQHRPESQQGSGSAENKGQDRSAQENPNTRLSKQETRKIAGEMGKGPNPVTSSERLGAMSGRDDASGGNGDRMEDQNTGQETDR